MSDEKQDQNDSKGKEAKEKKGFGVWKLIFMTAIVLVLINRYKDYNLSKSPYAPQLETYNDFQEAVVLKRIKFKNLRSSPPETIDAQDKYFSSLKKECNSLPQPEYAFQDQVYSAMLRWCTTMNNYQTYTLDVASKGISEEVAFAKMKEFIEQMISHENYMIDGMDTWPSDSEFLQKVEDDEFKASETKQQNSTTEAPYIDLEKDKLRSWAKGQGFVFEGMIRAIIEEDKHMFDRFAKQHERACSENKLVFENSDINSEIDEFCAKSTDAVRKIASIENRASSMEEINQVVGEAVKPLHRIAKIVNKLKDQNN